MLSIPLIPVWDKPMPDKHYKNMKNTQHDECLGFHRELTLFKVPEVVLLRAVPAVSAAGDEDGQGGLERGHQADAGEGGQEGAVARDLD